MLDLDPEEETTVRDFMSCVLILLAIIGFCTVAYNCL